MKNGVFSSQKTPFFIVTVVKTSNLMMDNVRTSQEAPFLYTTNPTG
jgi:hypothetical protein